MRRRQFLGVMGGAAATWPLAARAQQAGKVPRVAFLGSNRNNPTQQPFYQAFSDQLKENGFQEGQNIIVDYRPIEDAPGPFANAADLLRSQPDLIVAAGPEVALQAVIGAIGHTPIVMLAVNFDPIERGYVASLARPGGNITGVVIRPVELAAKQLELLTQAFPDRKRLAVLYDVQTTDQFAAADHTARTLGLEVLAQKLETAPYDFAAAFRKTTADGAQLVLVLSSPAFTQQRAWLAQLAIEHRLPTMFTFKLYAEGGGLMSYGAEFPPMWRRTADYVAKILKGAKPADLPIEQASKFELVVNLKTAKALEVTIPTAILLRADQVIE